MKYFIFFIVLIFSTQCFGNDCHNIKTMTYVYYPTGELLLEASYRNGKLDGVSRGYRPDGTLYKEIIYKNSKEIKRNAYPQDKPIIV